MYKTIGVMGALPEEVNKIVAGLEKPAMEHYAGVDYHIGRRGGRRLIVCSAGMGKVNAAQVTQVLITHFEVDAIIFSGIAGNMCNEIGIGDVVIASEVKHHDADDRMMSQSAPHTAVYKTDPLLVDALKVGCELTNTRYVVGLIATGDQFVGDIETKNRIQALCSPACVEMEGAAVGQVAMRNKVPFAIIRAMSDNCEESVESLGAEEFEIDEYVKVSSAIVLATVDSLKSLD